MADISVPCWNDVNIDDLCAGARLIAFDLDNTLARSKKPMKDDIPSLKLERIGFSMICAPSAPAF